MGPKFGECEPKRFKALYFWWGEILIRIEDKTSFTQISLSRFSKDEQFFVLRFDVGLHKCNPFSFDVKWQIQREKNYEEKSFSVFLPCRSQPEKLCGISLLMAM